MMRFGGEYLIFRLFSSSTQGRGLYYWLKAMGPGQDISVDSTTAVVLSALDGILDLNEALM